MDQLNVLPKQSDVGPGAVGMVPLKSNEMAEVESPRRLGGDSEVRRVGGGERPGGKEDLTEGGGFASYVQSLRKDPPEPQTLTQQQQQQQYAPVITQPMAARASNGYNVLKLGTRESRISKEIKNTGSGLLGLDSGGKGILHVEAPTDSLDSPRQRRLSGQASSNVGMGLLQNQSYASPSLGGKRGLIMRNASSLAIGSPTVGLGEAATGTIRGRHNALTKTSAERRLVMAPQAESPSMASSGGVLPGRNIIECTKFAIGGTLTPVKHEQAVKPSHGHKSAKGNKQWKSPFASRT